MARRIVFVVFDDLQILDLTGPLEVFSNANRALPDRSPAYTTVVVSRTGAVVRASCGLAITTDGTLATVARGDIDTLVVVGGPGTAAAAADRRLVSWVARTALRCRRVASVCSGAFILGRAGLLDGRRATTHWSQCDALARLFPTVSVATDPIFVRDGNVWTSAGVTAGMDLALRLVEDDLGPGVARTVARWLVLFVQRPGGQSQFSTQLAAQQPERASLRELTAWIPGHLTADLRVDALAGRAGMSARNFARAFAREVGSTPAAFVEATRLEAACRLLETTDRPVAAVARDCGFGTVATLHRAFQRARSITPGEYRHRFAHAASA